MNTSLNHSPPQNVEELLSAHVAGTLAPAVNVLARAHIAMNAPAARFVQGIDTLAGAVLETAPMAPLHDEALARTMARFDENTPASEASPKVPERHTPAAARAGLSDIPDIIARQLPTSLDALPWKGPWKGIVPGMREYRVAALSDDHVTTKLIRLAPGHHAFAHSHDAAEITLVLKGAYRDEHGQFTKGDVQCLPAGAPHQPRVQGHGECVCFTVNCGAVRVPNILRQFICAVFQSARTKARP